MTREMALGPMSIKTATSMKAIERTTSSMELVPCITKTGDYMKVNE